MFSLIDSDNLQGVILNPFDLLIPEQWVFGWIH